MKKSIAAALSLGAVLALIALVLIRAADISQSVYCAMHLSASRVIPSLFPLCVLACFLLERGSIANWQILAPLARLFCLDAAAAPACLLGSICGYPIGAAVLSDLFAHGEISRESAERALAFCNNASPAFLVSIVGYTMFGSLEIGFYLLAVHLLSAFMTGLALSHGKYGSPQRARSVQKIPFPTAFTRAVQRASLTMVQIAGFIVLFSALLCLLTDGSGNASALLGGILELTNGLSALQRLCLPQQTQFIAASAMLGWSGLCVHAQVLSFALPLGLSPIPYLKGKLLQCAVAAVIALPFAQVLPQSTAVAAMAPAHPSALPVLLIWALGFLMLFFYLLFHARRSIIR